MSEFLLSEDRDGVRLLTLNRAQKKNAINNEMWLALAEAFRAADADDTINCLVLTGSGGCFSAGVDLASFGAGDAETTEEHPFGACARAVAGFGKPWIGAATGIAVGGGATILFHADICYVGEGLRMRLPFASLGLAPEFASSYMLQANIGAQQAAELFYTAEWINAERAVETGIAARCYPDESLLEAALEKATEIAQWPVNSLREIKATLRLPHEAHIAAALEAEDAAMARQAGSAENIEAIMAFMEKRAPNFRKP
ncbi:MAG: enoyl-CoA hydratase-related protein [Halieaceae bacterium]